MVLETWTTVAIPLLEKVLSGEENNSSISVTREVFAEGRETPVIQRTVAALIEDGYIAGAGVHWPLRSQQPTIVGDVLRLTPKGRRAVGQWPSGQSGDVLIRTLEASLIELPEGETKGRIRALLQAAREVGVEVLTGVVTNVVKSTMGLP